MAQVGDSQNTILIEVKEKLGIYVYALVDPRSNAVFYIGKGTGDRIIAHAKAVGESSQVFSAKQQQIQQIKTAGLEVGHYFLRTNIETDAEAFVLEQIAIDSLKLAGVALTNLAAGHGSSTDGAVSLSDKIIELAATPMPSVEAPMIIFKLNKLWKKGMTDSQLADITRGYWRMGADTREKAKIAVAVVFGVVKGVYRIKPGSWHNGNRTGLDITRRWGFETEPAPEFQHLIGTQVRDIFPKGSQTPFRKFLNGYEAD